MSGIFGIINTLGAPIERAWLESMRENLAHQGPDGSGIYHQGAVGLGHLLLQVTPESKYEQSPCYVEGLVVVADARLDAREELMDQLSVPHERRLTITDPEMIGLAYRKWGEHCVEYLLGDFAFAVWDHQTDILFCARDHVGVKPFLYALQNGIFVFATELKAIVLSGIISTEIDHLLIRDRIIAIDDQPENTCWANITRLLGARSLTLANGKIKTSVYWDLKHRGELKFKNEGDYGAALRSLLEQAIADRMRTHHEIGAPLSGGLDSSTIACLAAAKLKPESRVLHTVSSVLAPGSTDSMFGDETEYIQEVLNQESNIKPGFEYSNQYHFFQGIEKQFDQHFSPINLWHAADEALFKRLKMMGVRRVLSGFLGDVTVSNSTIYPFPYMLLKGQWIKFFKTLRLFKSKNKLSHFFILKRELLFPLLPFWVFKAWFRIKKSAYPWAIDSLPLQLDTEEKKRLIKRIESQYQKRGYYTHPDPYKNIWSLEKDQMKEEWNCTAAHYGLEITYPLLDKRIIEFLYQVPLGIFYQNGYKRGLIRAAMANRLPDKVLYRQNKGHYSPGFQDGLKEEIHHIVSNLMQNKYILKESDLIDIEKTINKLLILEKSPNKLTFDLEYWGFTSIVMWSSFSIWNKISTNFKSSKHEK